MKKVMTAALLALGVSSAAQAQGLRLGLKAGVNLANFSGKDVDESKVRVGPNAGVAIELGLSDMFALQPELLYSAKGSRIEYQQINSTRTTTLHYLDIPLLIKLKADGPFFEVGPQLGFLLGAKRDTELGTVAVSDKNKDPFNTVDLGAVIGVGYEFGSASLGVRYNPGFRSLRSEDYRSIVPFDEIPEKTYNSTFTFQLGYMFGD